MEFVRLSDFEAHKRASWKEAHAIWKNIVLSGAVEVALIPSGGGTITLRSDAKTLQWTKIGRQMTVTGNIYVDDVPSLPSGHLDMIGLPGPIGEGLSYISAVSLYGRNLEWSTDVVVLQGYVYNAGGQTKIRISRLHQGEEHEQFAHEVIAGSQFHISATYFLEGAASNTFGFTGTASGVAHDLLSARHGDTLPAAVVQGAIIYGNATPKWAALAPNATATKKYLSMTSSVMTWEEIAGGDIPAHQLDGAKHTVSGLTPGHFLKALSANAFGFAAHGLTYSDVGAAAAGHNHDEVYSLIGHNHSGVYEPILGNPASDGYILSSTALGVRSWIAPSGGGAHNLLSATHGDTTAAAVVRGDMIVGVGASPNTKWARVAADAAGTYWAGGTDPAWATLNQAAVAGLTTTDGPTLAHLHLTNTIMCGDLTDGYIPYHVSDAAGLANGPIRTDGTRIAIGTSALSDRTFFVTGDLTTGASQYGFVFDSTLSGTTLSNVFYVGGNIKASTAVTNFKGFWIADASLYPGASIVNQYGLYIDAPTKGSVINYAIYAGGNSYFVGDVNCGSLTDHTAYPKTKAEAYAAIASMRLNEKGDGLDHGNLHRFLKSGPDGRNLSATVSALSEVTKDLITRIGVLEATP